MTDVTRREVLKLGMAASLALGTASRPARAQRGLTRPNILLLMSDQHRGDCLGVDGNSAIHTPNLDRLAQEGAQFRCAYSTTPTCTPARAALLTGMSPWRHGMLGYHRVAERYPVEMPRALRELGYYTTGIGKMHWTPQRNLHGFHKTILDESGREQSPDFRSDYRAWFASVAPSLNPDATGIGWNSYRAGQYVLPEELHPTHWTGQTAVNFIKGYEQPEPFFLKVSFARPHSPYDPPERLWKRYEDASLPERFVGDWADRYRPRSGDTDTIWHGDLGAEQARRSRQGFYGSVSFIDEQIGRVLEALEDRGWLDETLIIFLSDHGDMLGDHHMWRKSYAYEPSARVPMLLRWPDGLVVGPRGQVRDEPVEIRDVLPTFLDAASGTRTDMLDGRSLLPLVSGGDADWREYIDLEHDICYSERNHWTALTNGKEKYIFHARDGEEQLFDLSNDPGEQKNLASEARHSAKLQQWRGRMVAHLEERGEPFVVQGRLGLRPESNKLSPYYPSESDTVI